jgi:hypothetical protein
MLFSFVPRHLDPEQTNFSMSNFEPQLNADVHVDPMGTARASQQKSRTIKSFIDT